MSASVAWTDPAYEVCQDYVWQGIGGGMLTMPSGMSNAILTNIGAAIIAKLVIKIRYASKQQENYVTLFLVFLFSYFNGALLVMIRFEDNDYLPRPFTPKWLVFYGSMIKTSMILSNLMPYMGILIKIAIRRCCLCCKRKNYKPNTHLNPEFPLVRRYAFLLRTMFTCFTYGFAIPTLFLVAFVVIVIQYFLDKLLITFFHQAKPESNDIMNRWLIACLKYGVAVGLFFGGVQVATNHCTVLMDKATPLKYVTSSPSCFEIDFEAQIMFYSSFGLFGLMLFIDIILNSNACIGDLKTNSELSNADQDKRYLN